MWLTTYIRALAIAQLLPLAYSKPFRDTLEWGIDDEIVPGHPHFRLRILPLGASITWGKASTDGNGYRKHLRELLEQRGTIVEFVGTMTSGNMSNNENEGHPGARVDQVALFALNDIQFQPNLILINVGTNDAISEAPMYPLSTIGERMSKLIDYLFDQIPNVTIILSTLILNTQEGVDKRISNIINPQYQDIVHSKQQENKRVGLAALHAVVAAGELIDGTHPNDYGYEKMAEAWLSAIYRAGHKGLLVESKGAGGPDINVPPQAKPTAQSFLTVTKATPTASSSGPQMSCTMLGIQGAIELKPGINCTVMAKAFTNINSVPISDGAKINLARTNKPLMLRWWR